MGERVNPFGVGEEKAGALRRAMERLDIREQDLKERFVRSGGPGGQNVNKVSSCVVLTHLPTGIEIKMQRERSQALNRFLARRVLVDRIERERLGRASAERQRIEKIRRQKRRRSRRAKNKLLASKKLHSRKKVLRRAAGFDD